MAKIAPAYVQGMRDNLLRSAQRLEAVGFRSERPLVFRSGEPVDFWRAVREVPARSRAPAPEGPYSTLLWSPLIVQIGRRSRAGTPRTRCRSCEAPSREVLALSPLVAQGARQLWSTCIFRVTPET